MSLCLLLALWAAGAAVAESELLPAPWTVLALAREEYASGDLTLHLSATLLRVSAAFIIAMAIGSMIGIALGLSARADQLFDAWLVFALNVPALVTIILCYIWFGLTEAAAVTAVAINKIPNVAVTMREGAKSLEPAFSDVARVFRLSWAKRMRYVVLPQLQPYFFASMRSGLALIWKIVLVVELLGRGSGVGFQIHLYFQLFDIGRILVYALSFILIIQLIELDLMQPLERHMRRWRT